MEHSPVVCVVDADCPQGFGTKGLGEGALYSGLLPSLQIEGLLCSIPTPVGEL